MYYKKDFESIFGELKLEWLALPEKKIQTKKTGRTTSK